MEVLVLIYILAVSVSFLLIIAYYLFEQDIFSPSVIICSTILLCILCALLNVKSWDINYHFNTYVVMITGIVSFILPSICVFLFYKRKISYAKNIYKENNYTNNLIEIQNWKTFIIILFNIIVFAWYFKEIYRISLLAGNTEGIAGMMSAFRMGNSYGTVSSEQTIPTILNQCIKFNRIFAYIYLYAYINNIIIHKNYKKNIMYIFPIIGFAAQTILGSDRIYLILLVCAGLVMAYLLLYKYNKFNKNISNKFIKICIKSLLIVFVIFFSLRNIIGHQSTESDSAINYITKYVGGSVQLFDLYMQNPIEKSQLWGKETFSSVYLLISKFDIVEPYKRHLEFRESNGIIIGNVYGAFRKYYQDFGILGVIILQIISAYFFNTFYYYIKYNTKKNSGFKLLLYAFIVHGLFYIPIDDLIFSGLISMNYLTLIIYLRIWYWILIEKKVIFKNSYQKIV